MSIHFAEGLKGKTRSMERLNALMGDLHTLDLDILFPRRTPKKKSKSGQTPKKKFRSCSHPLRRKVLQSNEGTGGDEERTPKSKTNDAWKSSQSLRAAILHFHHETTRFPPEAIKEGKKELEHHIGPISTKLKRTRFISRLEYTGSVWEGVKSGTSELEFDLMFVLCGFENVIPHPIPDKPGYFTLSVPRDVASSQDLSCYLGRDRRRMSEGSATELPSVIDSTSYCRAAEHPDLLNQPWSIHRASFDPTLCYLMPEKVVSKLCSNVNKCLQEEGSSSRDLKCRRHGPALQLDVNRPRLNQIWFTVDLVPTIEIREGGKVRRFVAKPFKEIGHEAADLAWRVSYSLEEKAILKTMDRGNGCRKQCLRILKAIRDREPTLGYLHSFIFKTIVLKNGTTESWDQRDLSWRVLDMLEKLANALEAGYLTHYFDTEMNILASFSATSMKQSADRIRELLRSEAKFRRLIGLL